MKKILIIGIGAGDPDYITVQGIKALNRADVFFLMDKGPAKTSARKSAAATSRRDAHTASSRRRARRAIHSPPTTAPAWTS